LRGGLTNSESHPRLERDRPLEAEGDAAALPRVHEAVAARRLDRLDGAGDVGRAEEELRLVADAERRVAAGLVGREDVQLRVGRCVRLARVSPGTRRSRVVAIPRRRPLAGTAP
jgi:hypothetical protein